MSRVEAQEPLREYLRLYHRNPELSVEWYLWIGRHSAASAFTWVAVVAGSWMALLLAAGATEAHLAGTSHPSIYLVVGVAGGWVTFVIAPAVADWSAGVPPTPGVRRP